MAGLPANLSLPRVFTDAEWKVMQVFWERGASNLREVIEALETESDWKPGPSDPRASGWSRKGALAVVEENGREFATRRRFPRPTASTMRAARSSAVSSTGALFPSSPAWSKMKAISRNENDQLAASSTRPKTPIPTKPPNDTWVEITNGWLLRTTVEGSVLILTVLGLIWTFGRHLGPAGAWLSGCWPG